MGATSGVVPERARVYRYTNGQDLEFVAEVLLDGSQENPITSKFGAFTRAVNDQLKNGPDHNGRRFEIGDYVVVMLSELDGPYYYGIDLRRPQSVVDEIRERNGLERNAHTLPKAIGEMAGATYSDMIGIGAAVGEMQLTSEFINSIPVAEGIDVTAITAGDDDVLEVAAVVEAGTSKRGWYYTREALQKIVGEVNSGGLPGYKGHLTEAQVNNVFVDPVTHWVGAKEIKTGVFAFRGIVDKAAGELKRWIRSRRINQVSIFGRPIKTRGARGEVRVIDYEPISIDWTPYKRAGMPTFVVVGEQEDIVTDPGKEPAPGKGGSVDLDQASVEEITAELRKRKTGPEAILGEMSWTPDVVMGTPAFKEVGKDKVLALLPESDRKTIEAAEKVYGEVAELYKDAGESPDYVELIKADNKVAGEQRTDDHSTLVKKVVNEKIEGETAQALVTDLLKGELQKDASEEKIGEVIGEILERPHLKTSLKSAMRTAPLAPASGEMKGGNKDGNKTSSATDTPADLPAGVKRTTVRI